MKLGNFDNIRGYLCPLSETPRLAEAAFRATGKDSTNLNASIQERIKKRIMEAKVGTQNGLQFTENVATSFIQ